MKKLSKKEQIGIFKAGASSYFLCSAIGYFKEGGIQFINQAGSWTIKIHKTMGIIDVFRFDGYLKDLDMFGGDWLLMVFGMGMAVISGGVMKLIYWFQSEGEEEVKTEKTDKGFKVKLKKPTPSSEPAQVKPSPSALSLLEKLQKDAQPIVDFDPRLK